MNFLHSLLLKNGCSSFGFDVLKGWCEERYSNDFENFNWGVQVKCYMSKDQRMDLHAAWFSYKRGFFEQVQEWLLRRQFSRQVANESNPQKLLVFERSYQVKIEWPSSGNRRFGAVISNRILAILAGDHLNCPGYLTRIFRKVWSTTNFVEQFSFGTNGHFDYDKEIARQEWQQVSQKRGHLRGKG